MRVWHLFGRILHIMICLCMCYSFVIWLRCNLGHPSVLLPPTNKWTYYLNSLLKIEILSIFWLWIPGLDISIGLRSTDYHGSLVFRGSRFVWIVSGIDHLQSLRPKSKKKAISLSSCLSEIKKKLVKVMKSSSWDRKKTLARKIMIWFHCLRIPAMYYDAKIRSSYYIISYYWDTKLSWGTLPLSISYKKNLRAIIFGHQKGWNLWIFGISESGCIW